MSSIPNVIPKLGKPAPKFSGKALLNGNFVDIKLDDYAGKYVILFFYPMDFTFVCPTEIIAFSDRSGEFEALNTKLIACSTDTVYSHKAWTDQSRNQGGLGEIKIPILADPTHAISRSYGILQEEGGVSFRGLYIIDKAGVLRQMTLNDMPVGRSVDEVKRLVEAFQHTDEHGEVCPINWKKGDKGIKPGSKPGKDSGDS